ncbi:MAG: hypothetical protein H6Q99_297 [Proteobacteria bacterium]|nr:hypothetical protein [Pseudomonadota bacterium]
MAAQMTPRERWAAIEKTRELAGLSWADIARMAKVSEATLYNYRNGRQPRHLILARIEMMLASLCAAPELAGAAE